MSVLPCWPPVKIAEAPHKEYGNHHSASASYRKPKGISKDAVHPADFADNATIAGEGCHEYSAEDAKPTLFHSAARRQGLADHWIDQRYRVGHRARTRKGRLGGGAERVWCRGRDHWDQGPDFRRIRRQRKLFGGRHGEARGDR